MSALDALCEAILERRGGQPVTATAIHRVHTPSGAVWDFTPDEWRVFRREVRRMRGAVAAESLSRNRHGRRRKAAARS